jgi:hypothetical protein
MTAGNGGGMTPGSLGRYTLSPKRERRRPWLDDSGDWEYADRSVRDKAVRFLFSRLALIVIVSANGPRVPSSGAS